MVSLTDLFDDTGFAADPAKGIAGMLSPTDKLMALSKGLSMLGAGLSVPGTTGQRLAQGFVGLGQGMSEGQRAALQNRMVTDKLAEQQKQKTARERLALGMKTGGAGGASMLRVPGLGQPATGGPTAGATGATMADNPMFADLLDAYPDAAGKIMVERMMPKERNPLVVAPGSTVLGADGKPMYTAPDRANLPKAGDVRKFIRGDQEISQEFDPVTMTWKDLGAGSRWQPDQTLVQIHDPSSPTGARYVPRSQALNQPGRPEAGMQITSDGKGGFAVTTGRGAGQGGLQTKTQAEIEEQLINASGQAQQLGRITQAFKPQYQELGTRWSNYLTAGKEKAGFTPSEPEKAALADFSTYRAEAGQFFAKWLKEQSGSAVTESEAVRQETYLPKTGTGYFDGDSPTEFKSKLDRMTDFINNATARLHYVSKNGLGIKDVPLDKMPTLIRERGEKIAATLQGKGIAGDDLKAAVSQQLAREFGLLR